MLKIHKEHTFLSGDGFNAWTTYPRCKNDLANQYISGCFDNLQNVRPGIQQPKKSQSTTIMSDFTTIEPTTLFETTTKKSFKLKTSKKPSLKNSNKDETKEQKHNSVVTTTKKIRSKSNFIKSPFNIFTFYLSDYTSKPPAVSYRPIQFDSKKSIVIIDERSKTQSNIEKKKSSTQRVIDDHKIISSNTLAHYRRVVGNITPHSIDYLLKLTTPRSNF